MTAEKQRVPAPKRRGAPYGNLNGAKSGNRIHRMAFGQLPTTMHRITRYCHKYRKALEAAVDEHYGEVSLMHAHVIDAACTHEQHAGICRHLLRMKLEKMSTADVRECSKQIAAAKDARNKCVRELNLDRQPESFIDALYTSIEPEEDDE